MYVILVSCSIEIVRGSITSASRVYFRVLFICFYRRSFLRFYLYRYASGLCYKSSKESFETIKFVFIIKPCLHSEGLCIQVSLFFL